MRIQVIQKKNNMRGSAKNVTLSLFSSPQSLDEFDVNLIDLSDLSIWENNEANIKSINCINDLKSLQIMVRLRRKSSIVYVLPQNITYKYGKSQGGFVFSKVLKDMIKEIREEVLSYVFPYASLVPQLLFENTRTKVLEKTFEGDFYFFNVDDVVTSSISSEKATTIRVEEQLYATTLNFSKELANIVYFVETLLKSDQMTTVPEWMSQISFFDDMEQEKIIDENEEKIAQAKLRIEHARDILQENAKTKSILYTTGDELVKIVLCILEHLFDCDLSSFVDEKKEDFLVKKEQCTFVGEIKGVKTNLKNEHISQVEVHYQSYLDKLYESEQEENAKQILIINAFRDKPLEEREPINDKQVKLAKSYGCLVVETKTLLRLYELFLLHKISSEQCIRIFSTETGILTAELIETIVASER